MDPSPQTNYYTPQTNVIPKQEENPNPPSQQNTNPNPSSQHNTNPNLPSQHNTNPNPPSQHNTNPNFSPLDIQRNYPNLAYQQTYMPYMQPYMPPNQYGGIPNFQQVFQGQFDIKEMIKNLEFKLNNGWYFAYTIWLGVITIIIALFCLVSFVMMFKEKNLTFGVFMVIPLCVWIIHFDYVIFKAMKNLDLKGAKNAFLSMIVFAVIYFIWIISMFYRGSSVHNPVYINDVVLNLTIFHIIPMGIYLFGAYSVCKLLEERETLLKIENVDAA